MAFLCKSRALLKYFLKQNDSPEDWEKLSHFLHLWCFLLSPSGGNEIHGSSHFWCFLWSPSGGNGWFMVAFPIISKTKLYTSFCAWESSWLLHLYTCRYLDLFCAIYTSFSQLFGLLKTPKFVLSMFTKGGATRRFFRLKTSTQLYVLPTAFFGCNISEGLY